MLSTFESSQVQIRHGQLAGGGRVDNWGPEKVRTIQTLMNTGRWRNDVGRRLADLEIVLGTHRREVQVERSQSNP